MATDHVAKLEKGRPGGGQSRAPGVFRALAFGHETTLEHGSNRFQTRQLFRSVTDDTHQGPDTAERYQCAENCGDLRKNPPTVACCSSLTCQPIAR